MTLIGEHIPLRIASSQGLGADAARRALCSISHSGEPQHDLPTRHSRPSHHDLFSGDKNSWARWETFAIIFSGIVSGLIAAAVVLLHEMSFLTAFLAYAIMGNAGSLVTAIIIGFIPTDE